MSNICTIGVPGGHGDLVFYKTETSNLAFIALTEKKLHIENHKWVNVLKIHLPMCFLLVGNNLMHFFALSIQGHRTQCVLWAVVTISDCCFRPNWALRSENLLSLWLWNVLAWGKGLSERRERVIAPQLLQHRKEESICTFIDVDSQCRCRYIVWRVLWWGKDYNGVKCLRLHLLNANAVEVLKNQIKVHFKLFNEVLLV